MRHKAVISDEAIALLSHFYEGDPNTVINKALADFTFLLTLQARGQVIACFKDVNNNQTRKLLRIGDKVHGSENVTDKTN